MAAVKATKIGKHIAPELEESRRILLSTDKVIKFFFKLDIFRGYWILMDTELDIFIQPSSYMRSIWFCYVGLERSMYLTT